MANLSKGKIIKYLKANQIKIGAVFLVLLTVLSAFGVVMDSIKTPSTSPKGEYIGSYSGYDFFRIDDKNHYVVIDGEEWHFRGDPLVAKDVNVTPEDDDILRALNGVDEVVLLLDPAADPRVIVASTDIARLMGIMQVPAKYAFTEKSEAHPEIPVMSAWDSDSKTAVVEFRAPQNVTRVSSQYPVRPRSIIIQGEDFDKLDAAVARVTLITFGVRGEQGVNS